MVKKVTRTAFILLTPIWCLGREVVKGVITMGNKFSKVGYSREDRNLQQKHLNQSGDYGWSGKA